MKIFEAELMILGNIRFEGSEYSYEAEIKDGDGYEEREYFITILEHGLSTELEDKIETAIIKELNKKKIALV